MDMRASVKRIFAGSTGSVKPEQVNRTVIGQQFFQLMDVIVIIGLCPAGFFVHIPRGQIEA